MATDLTSLLHQPTFLQGLSEAERSKLLSSPKPQPVDQPSRRLHKPKADPDNDVEWELVNSRVRASSQVAENDRLRLQAVAAQRREEALVREVRLS